MPAVDIYQIDSISMNGPNTSIDFSGNNNNPVISNVTLTYDPNGDQNDDYTLDQGDTFFIDFGDGNGPQVATADFTLLPNGSVHGNIFVFTVNGTQYGLNDGTGDIDYGGEISPGGQNNGQISPDSPVIVCFVRGTQIATPNGTSLVEDLAIGDEIATQSSGTQKIRWIGKVKVSANGHTAPICIKAGALGENSPTHDLYVSPGHRVVVSGWKAELLFGEPAVLAPAKSLVNDKTITVARDLQSVEYYHFMCDKHEIVLSNGAATESFHPNQQSIGMLDDVARAELLKLFPVLENADAMPFTKAALSQLTDAEASLLR